MAMFQDQNKKINSKGMLHKQPKIGGGKETNKRNIFNHIIKFYNIVYCNKSIIFCGVCFFYIFNELITSLFYAYSIKRAEHKKFF